MAGHGAKSEAARSLAALRLAAGGTVAQAAEQSGAAERSIHRWLAEDPAFRAAVDRLRGMILGRACGQMASRMAAAGDVLEGLLGSDDERVRLRAAVSIFDVALALKQAVDDARRLDELERRLGAMPGGRGAEQPGADESAG